METIMLSSSAKGVNRAPPGTPISPPIGNEASDGIYFQSQQMEGVRN